MTMIADDTLSLTHTHTILRYPLLIIITNFMHTPSPGLPSLCRKTVKRSTAPSSFRVSSSISSSWSLASKEAGRRESREGGVGEKTHQLCQKIGCFRVITGGITIREIMHSGLEYCKIMLIEFGWYAPKT